MGRLNPETDREYLQIAGLRQELLAAGLSQQALENKDKPYLDEIERRYRDLGIAGELPGPPQQYDAVRETIPVSDDALLALIQDRAVAIKTYLVSERGMEADRIAIEQTPLDDESHQFSGVELGLE